MENNEKLKVVFDFIYYYLSESNSHSNKVNIEQTSEHENNVNLNELIDVQRANELIKTFQFRDTLNANINKTTNDYEKKLKDYFVNLKDEFKTALKSYNEDDELNHELLEEIKINEEINDDVIDNTIITPKPIQSVLSTKKKTTTKK